jgi:membrane protein DedA with SNARE-associated domain
MTLPFVFTQQFVETLIDLAIRYGLVGSFILSFFSNLILFLPIPYLSIIFWLSLQPPHGAGLNPISLALVSGFGASLGKVIIYYIGACGRKFLGEQKKKNLDYAKIVIDKYGPLAIFIASATPVPDDVVYLPLGVMRYNPWKFFFYCLLGKIVLTLFISVSGYYSFHLLRMVPFGGYLLRLIMRESIWGIVITIALTVLVTYVTLKIDWEKLINRMTSEKK